MSGVQELWDHAEELPDGSPEKTALLDESVRLADAANDDDRAYQARIKLINAATWSGDIDKALVAFTWCLAKYRAAPNEHDDFEILWYFKWTVLEAPRFPQLSRERIRALLDDMERCYLDHDVSLRPVHQHRHYAAIELGDVDDAHAHYEKWWATPRDRYADCAACEIQAMVDYHSWRGDDAQVLASAEHLFRGGRRCSEVPHRTHALTLVPLLRAGRVDDALKAHRTGIKMLSSIAHNVACDIANHLAFLAVTGNFTAAKMLASKWIPRAASHARPGTRAQFWAALTLLCDRLDTPVWRIVLPPALSVEMDARGRVDVKALAEKAWGETMRIAKLFDQRNGNASFSALMQRTRALASLAIDAPLRAPR